jgi:hypothetical protein
VYVGVGVGTALILAILGVDAGLVWRIRRGPHNGITFLAGLVVLVSLAAIVLVVYRIYDLTQLRYEFDRNRLLIARAGMQHTIPIESIERVVDGAEAKWAAKIRGVRWPGCYIGPGSTDETGMTLFYGVDAPGAQTVIVTPVLAYGISVPDKDAFRQVFVACRQLGPLTQVRHETVRAPYLHWPIWRDRAAHLLVGAGVLLGALLFAVLLFRYPDLPARLPMHYDAAGRVDRIAPRQEAFVLPVIGTIAWVTNGLLGTLFYRRQRMLSYLAWSGTLIVQTLFLMALWEIVH